VKPDTGAAVEVLLLRNRGDNVWEALVRPGKKLRPGAVVSFGDGLLTGTIEQVLDDGNRLVRFSYEGIW
jgi:S-adenosylmethionine:tRNA ribosyltransferase-isomerase